MMNKIKKMVNITILKANKAKLNHDKTQEKLTRWVLCH